MPYFQRDGFRLIAGLVDSKQKIEAITPLSPKVEDEPVLFIGLGTIIRVNAFAVNRPVNGVDYGQSCVAKPLLGIGVKYSAQNLIFSS